MCTPRARVLSVAAIRVALGGATIATCMAAAPAFATAQETTRVSVDSTGVEGDRDSTYTFISADGRFVAFTSDATNLVAVDTNNSGDVFVHDRTTGTTERVSVDSSGAQANGFSDVTAISADGRIVAFTSDATNLVALDLNHVFDSFIRDRTTGSTER